MPKGTKVHVPIYADATYLFIFRTMATGIELAIDTLTLELASRGARPDGSLIKATLASASPADVLLQPIFNPVGGYASYTVPAAFVLILQQLLLIGASLLTVLAKADLRGDLSRQCLAPALRTLPSLCRRSHSISSCCRGSMAFPPWPASADLRAGLIVYSRDKLHGPGRGRMVQAPGDPHTASSLAPAFPSFFSPGLLGPGKPFRKRCRRWVISSPLISRSMVSFASISWAPVFGMLRATGGAFGASRGFVTLLAFSRGDCSGQQASCGGRCPCPSAE